MYVFNIKDADKWHFKKMKKTFPVIYFALTVLTIAGCKDGKTGGESDADSNDDDIAVADTMAYAGDTLHLFEEQEPPPAVDELFDDFFFNFADDRKFQNQRVSFPLPLEEDGATTSLGKAEWDDLGNFDSPDVFAVVYERDQDLELQKDTTINSVSVDKINLRGEHLQKYSFNRVGGKWMLTKMEKESLSQHPNGEFFEFYARFITDSLTQVSSLKSPLKLVLTPQGDDDMQIEELTPEDWTNMRADLPLPEDIIMSIDYGQSCLSQNRKILLVEGISNGFYMKFKFDKGPDGWKLNEIEY